MTKYSLLFINNMPHSNDSQNIARRNEIWYLGTKTFKPFNLLYWFDAATFSWNISVCIKLKILHWRQVSTRSRSKAMLEELIQ